MCCCYNEAMTAHKKYTPLSLANTFIARHGGEHGIQHMKLQKLAYYTYGWWLSHYATPILNEKPQVWKYGPVFKSMYKTLNVFGAAPIKEPQTYTPFENPTIIDDEAALNLIDWVWKRYSPYSATTLSDMTHKPGTPWRKIAEEKHFCVPENYEIPDEMIKEYFVAQTKELRPS